MYRVAVFGRPRAPWREKWEHAMEDAIAMELTSYDASRREYYLAVPTSIEAFTGFAPPDAP
ncbi:hypothetical protein FYJ91_18370 [Sphingomonas montanisoli]|uniref:Uncharacterized protein n=1 Tax=Sphingomonas montanisoli TaxID=2606412 RepID=A0A5D9BZ84_9SPHN|nr:hypothetical protein FYJ91_18370 [Sphingomonas montanisoli]